MIKFKVEKVNKYTKQKEGEEIKTTEQLVDTVLNLYYNPHSGVLEEIENKVFGLKLFLIELVDILIAKEVINEWEIKRLLKTSENNIIEIIND